ncbi:Bud-site selection protein [Phaeosphaeria sp. MPI-PUGE-AT-0046c]|nr:Bud-site selection protein [Phaeosphaeria sp. MPI-PUGE-AT-0046c]
MAKRKRSSNSPSPVHSSSPDPSERALKSQKRICNRCLLDAKKNLVAALRVGAGFERQKHSRRKKTAQAKKDTKGLARLDAEYAVLKGLEMEKVAEQHLRKTVGRVKSLKDQEALKTYVEGMEKGSAEPATLNVLARLYKVAAVKKVVDDAVEQLKGVFAVADTAVQAVDGGKKDAKKRKKAESGDVEMLDVSDEEGDPFEAFNSRIAAPSSGEEGSEGSVSDDERPPSIGDSESAHDPEDDLQADSESEDADAFAGFSEEEDEASDNDVTIESRLAPPSDVSGSDSDVSIPTKAKSKSKKSEPTITSSAFLPGLSHAAYIAGSDSDASDLSASFAPRKNRRGQRARQKIAEAKFGAKAKHLENADRNKGWDPKRGAVSTENRGYGPQQSGENTIPLGKKRGEGTKRDDKGDLHPSWLAAKAAKEKKMVKIEVGKGAGQGKKVIFD